MGDERAMLDPGADEAGALSRIPPRQQTYVEIIVQRQFCDSSGAFCRRAAAAAMGGREGRRWEGGREGRPTAPAVFIAVAVRNSLRWGLFQKHFYTEFGSEELFNTQPPISRE